MKTNDPNAILLGYMGPCMAVSRIYLVIGPDGKPQFWRRTSQTQEEWAGESPNLSGMYSREELDEKRRKAS